MKLKKPDLPKEKPKYTVFKEWGNIDEIDRLYRIYNQDHQKAKIIYTQNKRSFTQNRLILFEWSNGDFKICSLTKTYGISKNNIIYHREKTNSSIIYKKNGHKFYYANDNKYIKQLSFHQVSEMGLYEVKGLGDDTPAPFTPQYEYLLSKFGWLRNVEDNSIFWSISFSTIQRKKLFNTTKLFKHYFGSPIETCRMLIKAKEAMTSWRTQVRLDKSWSEMKKHLINLENITVEFLQSEYLFDASIMAEALGKKINCAWSPKRIKAEHDVWMKEVIDVILEFEPLRELKIIDIFKDFQTFSKYEMLTTNHELIAEGQRMNHCVGMYSTQVDNGNSCIYRVNGHTLELKYEKPWNNSGIEIAKKNGVEKILIVSQYMGYKNKQAPNELRLELDAVVEAFNNELKGDYDGVITTNSNYNDLLPF